MNAMTDPREIIDKSAMTTMQYVIVAITVLLNGMDGFDVLAISVSGPGIMGEWGINRAQLGVVLSMELIGMGVGSVLLGGLADKYGRRSMLLGCLIVMSSGMWLATTATDTFMLSVWRIYTGLGIGGMLSTTNAVVAEFSNNRRRAMCISLMVIGYPIGGIVCGEIGKALLGADASNWRMMFYSGAVMAAAMIPIVYFLVPESVHWLTRKQPEGALARINTAMAQMGQTVVKALPDLSVDARKKSVLDIFSPALAMTTILVTLAYFLHIVTFYFLLKWTPTIVTLPEMGSMPASVASGVLTWVNVGGALGGATFGLLTARVGLRPLSIGILLLSAISIALFGRSEPDLATLSTLAAFAGFAGNAGVSGLYSIVAYAFPTHVRATGTGFVIGVGRFGAVLAPMLAGYLLQTGVSLPTIGLVMGAGSLLAAGVLMFLKLGTDKPSDAPVTQGQNVKGMEASLA